MALSDLGLAIERLKYRRSNVFVFATTPDVGTGEPVVSGTHHVGETMGVRIRVSAIKSPASSTGRQHQYAGNFEATFEIMQTGDEELSNISNLIRENGYGTSFKFTEAPSRDGSAPGFVIENAGASVEEINLDLNGGQSMIRVSLTGYVDMTDIDALGQPADAADADRGIVIGDKVLTIT